MLKEKVEKALNAQIEKEIYSSHLYLSMASWAEAKGYEGISQWLYAQADEERIHFLKFIGYVNERGGNAVISAIKKPDASFKDVLTLFKQVLKHEEFISESINDVLSVCMAEKDFSTQNWLQWFVTEQIEEEKSVRNIIDKLKMIGSDGNTLYLFDKDIMSLRTANAAPAK